MATKALPVVEIAKDTYEIDEFDCGSIFVLVGADKAMVIDTGSGIGDLRGVIANITDKPIVLVITHAHGDHVGGLGWFDDYYMNKEDVGKYAMEGVDFRRQYAGFIAQRSGKEYAYNVEEDIRPWPADANPVRHDLEDGQTFDLGGGRIVTHTAELQRFIVRSGVRQDLQVLGHIKNEITIFAHSDTSLSFWGSMS